MANVFFNNKLNISSRIRPSTLHFIFTHFPEFTPSRFNRNLISKRKHTHFSAKLAFKQNVSAAKSDASQKENFPKKQQRKFPFHV